MSSARTPIGEILLRHEHLRPRELDRVLAEPDRKQRLVSMLILRALIDGDDATLALSEQTGYPGALERHLERRDPKLAKTFPPELMKTLAVVPLIRTAAGALVVISRDPSPALADVLRTELGVPIELAVTPAIFIDRLVQRLAGAAPTATPPSLPPIDHQGPRRHRKTVSVIMNAPLPDPGPPVRISSTIPTPIKDDADSATGLAPRPLAPVTPPPTTASIPVTRAGPPIIQIPERGSGVHPRPNPPGEGSGLQVRPLAPREGSGLHVRPRDGSGVQPRPQPPQDFETRTPPIGTAKILRPPAPPRPEPEAEPDQIVPPGPPGLKLDLDDEWADLEPPKGDVTPLVDTSAEDLRRSARDSGPPINRPTHRTASPTREIPIRQLEALAGETVDDTAHVDNKPPVDDPAPNPSSRPTRPAIVVPTEALAALDELEAEQSRPSVPQRPTPNIIKRPPTPLPVAPLPIRIAVEPEPEPPELDPAEAPSRPTRPRLQPPNTPPSPSPANDAETLRPRRAESAPIFAAKIGTDLSIVQNIERALSRATADRLLIKHAATRWTALLLVAITDDRAKGTRGHGSRLQAGVESIDLAIASSALLQAACDPTAEAPAGKDPLFELLGAPASPSSAPVVVDDRVVAVLAAGDAIEGGSTDELKALAGALAVAYQRFSNK